MKFKFKSIPVLLHIPKNAGSYIVATLTEYFIKALSDTELLVRRVTVHTSTGELTIFCKFHDLKWRYDKHFKTIHKDAPRASSCQLDTFIYYVDQGYVDILAIVVEPVAMNNGRSDLRYSIFNAHDLVKKYNNTSYNFAILRDPLSRAYSFFKYLQSDRSHNEPTHGAIKHDRFESYLSSQQLEDSWLVRVLTGIEDSVPVTEPWYQNAYHFLKQHNFKFNDITDVDKAIANTIHTCFGDDILNYKISTAPQNQNPARQTINLNDLNNNTRDVYSHRAKWDIMLYNKLLA